MDDRQAYRQKASERGIPAPVIEWFLQLARPRVVLHRDDQSGVDTATAPVVGHVGGNPWLPADVEWSGFPHFVASIDCAALPAGVLDIPFPEDGHLLFFADVNQPDFDGEDTYARIVHVPAGTATAERVPSDEPFMAERFPLRYELHWTLPGDYSLDYLLLREDSRNLYDKYDGSELGNEPWPYGGQLALGGHPLQIQDDPLLRFLPEDFAFPKVAIDPRIKASDAAAKFPNDLPLPPAEPDRSNGDPEGWLVLAEMREDLDWGEIPAVTYWMIRREDLAKKSFDRVKHAVEILE
jgi:hypothetical protein